VEEYLNTGIEELVISSLSPDEAFVQIARIQTVTRLQSQVVPKSHKIVFCHNSQN
jgi:hypothetical protein